MEIEFRKVQVGKKRTAEQTFINRFVPLPKSERADKIKANADVYGFELSEEEVAQLDAPDKGDKGAVTWNPTTARDEL